MRLEWISFPIVYLAAAARRGSGVHDDHELSENLDRDRGVR